MRPSGELTHLPERSLPLGIVAGQEYREGVIQLDAGDTLIVHSDGLVEREGDRTGDLGEFWDDLREAAGATDMVRRLLARMPVHLPDDVTILVLRRVAPEAPSTGES